VFPVRYELGFYIPEDEILHTLRSFFAVIINDNYRLVFKYLVGVFSGTVGRIKLE
jgi:hypothetical protein